MTRLAAALCIFFASGIVGAAITYIGAGAADTDTNASVTPTLHASTTSGDLILCPAYYRGGNVTPAAVGFDDIAHFGTNNEQVVLARIATGVGDSPTITVVGGTGTSILSQCLTFRGTLNTTTGIVVSSDGASNTVQQNVTYPGLTISTANTLVVVFGRKGDDWTSVATLSGFTEATDVSTTLGNDAGIVVDYQIQTTATSIVGDVFTVTGGGTAAGAGITLNIKPAAASCTGFEYTLDTLAPYGFDSNGSPNRLFGYPNDLEPAGGKVCITNIVGAGTAVVTSNGAMDLTSTVTAFDYDFTVGGTYTGSAATWPVKGNPPLFIASAIPTQTYAKSVVIVPYDLDDYFAAGESALSAYTLKKLSSASATDTANGAGTLSDELIVDDIATFAVGDWIKIGTVYARIKFIDPYTNTLGLWSQVTWADNDAVSIMTVGNCSVSGLAINGTTHAYEGTPDTDTTERCFFRFTDAASQTADSP